MGHPALSIGVSLFSSFPKPFYRFLFILRNTASSVVADTKMVLSVCIALMRRLAIPLCRFHTILCHANAIIVADAQTTLSMDISLIGGFPKPFESFLFIFRYALSEPVVFCYLKPAFQLPVRNGNPFTRCQIKRVRNHAGQNALRAGRGFFNRA